MGLVLIVAGLDLRAFGGLLLLALIVALAVAIAERTIKAVAAGVRAWRSRWEARSFARRIVSDFIDTHAELAGLDPQRAAARVDQLLEPVTVYRYAPWCRTTRLARLLHRRYLPPSPSRY